MFLKTGLSLFTIDVRKIIAKNAETFYNVFLIFIFRINALCFSGIQRLRLRRLEHFLAVVVRRPRIATVVVEVRATRSLPTSHRTARPH